MLEEIEIDSFKSLRNVSIQIKPITILIGLNSSGKSSVLQCLEVLKQTAKIQSPNLVTNGDRMKLGSFKDIVFKKEEKNEINFGIRGCREQFLEPPFGKETKYNYLFAIDSTGLKYHSSSISSGNFYLKGEYNRGKGIKSINVPTLNGTVNFNPHTAIGHPFYHIGNSGNVEGFNFLDLTKFLSVIEEELNNLFLVPAIRGISSPSYPLDSVASEDIMDANNLNAQAIKFTSTFVYESPEIERKINKWIGRVTGIATRARTVPDKQAAIETFRKIDANIVNEGFGSNQLVHLFTQIATAPPYSTIGIEEPETHLHPKAQSELAKVLIEIPNEEKKNLILTTHSEHILYRVLIEIARGKLNLNDVAIYHFRLSEDGSTSVERLNVDEKGRLEKKIPDFFETDLNEFKEFLESLRA